MSVVYFMICMIEKLKNIMYDTKGLWYKTE